MLAFPCKSQPVRQLTEQVWPKLFPWQLSTNSREEKVAMSERFAQRVAWHWKVGLPCKKFPSLWQVIVGSPTPWYPNAHCNVQLLPVVVPSQAEVFTPNPMYIPVSWHGSATQVGIWPMSKPLSHRNSAGAPECPAVHVAMHRCPCSLPVQSVMKEALVDKALGTEHSLRVQLGPAP